MQLTEKVPFNFNFLRSHKKRSDVTYLTCKEKKTDPAAKPSKNNGRNFFSYSFFYFTSSLSCKF